ncbi:hypothetical protein JW926_08660, partial [Candidatus Sumerlaeota bacterium]|nr:hypothetical protein [Candidatus Sumerlaeota bacterium]
MHNFRSVLCLVILSLFPLIVLSQPSLLITSFGAGGPEETGNIEFNFQLSDAESDLCSIRSYYSTDLINFFPARTTGQTKNLNSSPLGVSHSIIWNSHGDIGDLPGYNGTVQFRIIPFDLNQGTGDTEQFILDNNDIPNMSIQRSPTGLVSGNVQLIYTITDDNNNLNLEVEYTTDTLNWFTASGLPKINLLPGRGKRFTWDTIADLPGFYGATLRLRLRLIDTDSDQTSWIETGIFSLNNNVAVPVITDLTTPVGEQSFDVSVTYTLTDPDSPYLDIEAEYTIDGSIWNTASGGPKSHVPTGVGKVFTWNSYTDLPGYNGSTVKLRLRAVDLDGKMSSWIETGNFTLDNNTDPVVSAITTPSGEQSGNIGITYDLTDPDTALLSIEAEFTTDTVTWLTATGAPKANIAPGTGIAFVWNSATDLGSYSGSAVQIRIRAVDTDSDMSAWDTTGVFTIDSNIAPVVSAITTPSGEQSGNVGVTYTLTDPDTTLLSIEAEFTTDTVTWLTATGAPKANIAPGTGIAFVWNSATDLGSYSGSAAQLRIRAVDTDSDMSAWDATGAFTLDNNATPVVSAITTPSGEQIGDVGVTYTLTDSDTAQLNIEAEYTTDGANWFTASGTPKANVAPGTGIAFTWNSATDLGSYSGSTAQLRIRAIDTDSDASGWDATGAFTLD